MFDRNPLTSNTYIIKSGYLHIYVLKLLMMDTDYLTYSINKILNTKDFSQNHLLALDIDQIDFNINFESIKKIFNNLNLTLIGIIGGTEQQKKNAFNYGINLLPTPDTSQIKKNKDTEPFCVYTETVTNTIRSGQKIYAKNKDLICIGTINHGAEIIADGNIHIYGKLSGRAMAGASGCKTASIFCLNYDAELISIAGFYSTNINLNVPKSTTIQIQLIDNNLQVKTIK